MWRLNSGNIIERVIVSDHGSWENAAGRVAAPGGHGADVVPGTCGGTDGHAATGPGAPDRRGALQRHQLAALLDRGLGPVPGRLGRADPVAGRPGGLAAVQPPSHAPRWLRRSRVTDPAPGPGPPASAGRPRPARPSSRGPPGWRAGCGAAGRAGARRAPPPAPPPPPS